ncbi:hypothetical protein CDCA_CDCA07G2260 [Cyanidium caldarium]|uniref:SAP domain-containing protein n=1 Tax=Cyanidium caldarium TaxID=2771 RepID=A0AAV9IVW0_CYACA|nr:hypothetical protein CDCA_CDCA07G2260 [Cyanidium caldarium]
MHETRATAWPAAAEETAGETPAAEQPTERREGDIPSSPDVPEEGSGEASPRRVASDSDESAAVAPSPVTVLPPSTVAAAAAAAGVRLGDLPNVNYVLSHKFNARDEVLKGLHAVLYHRPGKRSEVKQNLREWSGLATATEAQRERMRARLGKWKLELVKQACTLLDLPLRGTKDELVQHMVAFLERPHAVAGRRDLVAAAARKRKQREARTRKRETGARRAAAGDGKRERVRKRQRSEPRAAATARQIKSETEASGSEEEDAESDSDFVPSPQRPPPPLPPSAASPLDPMMQEAARRVIASLADLASATIKQVREQVEAQTGVPIQEPQQREAFRALVTQLVQKRAKIGRG